jgi:hypothetical protein
VIEHSTGGVGSVTDFPAGQSVVKALIETVTEMHSVNSHSHLAVIEGLA